MINAIFIVLFTIYLSSTSKESITSLEISLYRTPHFDNTDLFFITYDSSETGCLQRILTSVLWNSDSRSPSPIGPCSKIPVSEGGLRSETPCTVRGVKELFRSARRPSRFRSVGLIGGRGQSLWNAGWTSTLGVLDVVNGRTSLGLRFCRFSIRWGLVIWVVRNAPDVLSACSILSRDSGVTSFASAGISTQTKTGRRGVSPQAEEQGCHSANLILRNFIDA